MIGLIFKNRMKKILFVINTLSVGGAEHILLDVVNNLSKHYDITLLSILDIGIYRNNIDSAVEYKSIVKVKNEFIRKILMYFISFLIPSVIIHKLFIGNKYDYEVAFLEGVPTKLIAASGNKKSKKYAWVHIDLFNQFGIKKVFRSMSRHIDCYRKYDKIICVSESVRDAFIKRFGIYDKLVVKYNPLNYDIITKLADEPVKKSNRLRLVSVGRLEKQKGHDRLVQICKCLLIDGFDFELIIIGDGSDRYMLEKFISENCLNDSIFLLGFVENPYPYMKNADLLVFPSRVEGYSTVVTESIILGKPVVVSNCAGMKEILGESEYGLVTENNIESLYNGIKVMLSNEKVREYYAGQAAKRSIDLKKRTNIDCVEELFK